MNTEAIRVVHTKALSLEVICNGVPCNDSQVASKSLARIVLESRHDLAEHARAVRDHGVNAIQLLRERHRVLTLARGQSTEHDRPAVPFGNPRKVVQELPMARTAGDIRPQLKDAAVQRCAT